MSARARARELDSDDDAGPAESATQRSSTQRTVAGKRTRKPDSNSEDFSSSSSSSDSDHDHREGGPMGEKEIAHDMKLLQVLRKRREKLLKKIKKDQQQEAKEKDLARIQQKLADFNAQKAQAAHIAMAAATIPLPGQTPSFKDAEQMKKEAMAKMKAIEAERGGLFCDICGSTYHKAKSCPKKDQVKRNPGDWDCYKCKFTNRRKATACFKCGALWRK